MRLTLPRLRARRRATSTSRRTTSTTIQGDDRASRAFGDRSQLLAELEVSVPAPERIVAWEAARRSSAVPRG